MFNIGGIEWKKVRGLKFFGSFEIFLKKFFERICIYFSDVIVVDNKVIQDYVSYEYGRESILAEYGGDHSRYEPIPKAFSEKFPFLNNQYDVSVARAQEDMNIHLILESYRQVKNRNIVIISNWDSSDYGRSLKLSFKDKFGNIFLFDAIYDLVLLNSIRSNSNLYIHSHSLCGTAPSLTEAMNLRLPTICYNAKTNIETTENKSLYFDDTKSLVNILSNLNDNLLNDISKNMHEIAKRRYTWDRIALLYKGILEYE